MFGFKRMGSRVVASTPDIRLQGGCLHAGTITGKTNNHYRIRFDEPNKRTGEVVEFWVYDFNVSLITSLKEG